MAAPVLRAFMHFEIDFDTKANLWRVQAFADASKSSTDHRIQASFSLFSQVTTWLTTVQAMTI